jgi:tetratricopeptide (TPR) repeat protein
LYDEMRDYTRAEPLWREALHLREDVSVQGSLGLCLLRSGKPADAELVLRKCLAICEKTEPDDWNASNTKSLLGGSLLGQKKYADAEPLLLAGYEGMKKREAEGPPHIRKIRLTDALERLVQLYEATEQKEKAAEWRKKLEAAKEADKKPTP